MIHIRPYHSTDLEALTELMSDLGYPTSVEQMKRRMEQIEAIPSYATFIASIDNKVVGMAGLRQNYTYEEDGCATQISTIVVKNEFQGKGIGKALVLFVEEWAAARNSTCIYLTSGIKPERMKAHQFYTAVGFETTGYRFVKRLPAAPGCSSARDQS
jgi:GNAT superfamily N-acetyltransferase